MVGQCGQKDSDHGLSTNHNLVHNPPYEEDQYYHNRDHHQYQWEHSSLPLLQTPAIHLAERPLGGLTDANK